MPGDKKEHTRSENSFSFDEETDLLAAIESYFQLRGVHTPVLYEDLKETFHALDEMALVYVLLELLAEGRISELEPGIFQYTE
ncbi:MAG: hypothetical protein ACXAEU_00055 [Candidatus Hodarchaeales archaeon]|jgi:hypothetical protein